MSYIQKIKTKRGTAHRVHYSKSNKPYSQYFPAGVPFVYVKTWAAQIDAQKLPHFQPAGITVKQLFEQYISGRSTEIDLTWHRSAMANFLKIVDQTTPADRVTWQTIHHYRDQRLQEKSQATTNYQAQQRARRGVNKELSNLRTVFNWAYKKDILPARIFDKVEFLKASEPNTDILTREEEKQFYKYLDKPYRLAYWILKYTGLRRSECTNLHWEHISLQKNSIRLLKTKPGEEAYVPIHSHLARIFHYVSKNKTGRIFPFHKDTLTSSFRRALDRAGLHHIKSPVHVFRHTVGARIMQTGVTDKNERLAQELLRHKTKAMTKHYTKIVLNQLSRELQTIDL
jgi:integrase